jgi:hypothetical protein
MKVGAQVIRYAKWQSHIDSEFMIHFVDLGEAELQRQVQQPWTGLCEDPLSDRGGTGRFDRCNPHIVEIAPFMRMREKSPDDLDRRVDDAGWRTHVSGIGLWHLF